MTEPSENKPMQARTALPKSNPNGLIFSTIGPAKNRSTNIKADVYTNNNVALPGIVLFMMLVIQLSVPNSTYPTIE